MHNNIITLSISFEISFKMQFNISELISNYRPASSVARLRPHVHTNTLCTKTSVTEFILLKYNVITFFYGTAFINILYILRILIEISSVQLCVIIYKMYFKLKCLFYNNNNNIIRHICSS